MSDYMNRPPVNHEDYLGRHIEAVLNDGTEVIGTVIDLWMSTIGPPSILRVRPAPASDIQGDIDIPYHAITFMLAPLDPPGWLGPFDTLPNDIPDGASTYSDNTGHHWWRPGT